MNLNKHSEFFDPRNMTEQLHIIGAGAIGSCVAELLVRLGCPEIHIYDFDTVDEHNITNQIYFFTQIGIPKVDALSRILREINPDVVIHVHPKGWTTKSTLNGYVFLAVDSIELRKDIVSQNAFNPNILAMFDFRMRLTDAQHYATDWTETGIKQLLSTMDFSEAEAIEATPVSACGTSLSITPTVRAITSLGVANFINSVMNKPLRKLIMLDAFVFNLIEM